MSIVNLLNQIKNEEVVLPAIQRDFVWPADKVLRLLDSNHARLSRPVPKLGPFEIDHKSAA